MGARAAGEETRFNGVSTDTRSVARGELFVAIRGERCDGHDFLAAAAGRGAAGRVCAQAQLASHRAKPAISQRKGSGRVGKGACMC